ncbi:MAG: lytic transglycosylase domain-containing protein [Pseudomonas sp.]|uniref:lytic transglycosylase domain-containing protein n=1 Tax=Pseudomonas alkylphenolica TaxID=237609 RepID=UPI0018D7E742|nr:lytic transglycosylase domain-containing protein [Pseudomonas alkylphenolica]MBH3431157.1 lytic transglycosylase domain-containing protein [Pseudomonas alkylphenolica]
MRWLTAGLFACLACTGPVEADVYISVKADGSYVLSNVHRPGRTYQRVVSEPVASLGNGDQPQLITGMPYAELVAEAAEANDVPAALLHAVIQAESRYNPNARSASGAVGLMQLMPDTARELGVKNSLDPASNVQGGARYLKRMLTMFDNDITLAVAAYNAGPDAVMRRGSVPPYAETQRYVPKVLRQYRRLQGLAMDAPL